MREPSRNSVVVIGVIIQTVSLGEGGGVRRGWVGGGGGVAREWRCEGVFHRNVFPITDHLLFSIADYSPDSLKMSISAPFEWSSVEPEFHTSHSPTD